MRSLAAVTIASALAVPGVVEAQLSRRSVALEAVISADARSQREVAAGAALRATAWLEGPVEAIARVALGSARETGGRATAVLSGTIGLRLSRGTGPLRPQFQAEVGWAREAEVGSGRHRPAWGIGAGLEWFPALDRSFALGTALRRAGGGVSVELGAAVAAYF